MLEKAFKSLEALPPELQDELGRSLISYTARWQELRAEIEKGADELKRGEGIEVSDIDAFLRTIEKKHGRF